MGGGGGGGGYLLCLKVFFACLIFDIRLIAFIVVPDLVYISI